MTTRIKDIFHSQWKNALHIVCITILAILFARFVVYDFMSLSVFAPLEKAADFQMSDIYQSVADSKAIHQLSSDISIVSIDGCTRTELLDAINIISEYAPTAIGLDVFFPIPEIDNTYLLATLSTTEHLVCAAKFEKSPADNTNYHTKQSFYEDSIKVMFGYANLNASSSRDIIRTFVPYVTTLNGDTLISLPAQLAKYHNPRRYQKLISRNKSTETIAYDNIEFPIISIAELLDGSVDESIISHRVVLIGDVHNVNDSYLSPRHEPSAGILLHAYALQTILSNNYIDSTSTWFNWFIAIALCIIFTICNLIAKYRMSNIGNLFVRIVQFGMIYILVIIGYAYFTSYHKYIDFSLSILMIGFGAIAFDVWFGCYALYNRVKTKIFKK